MLSRFELLLTCGVIAGPIFIVVSFGHALARSGFDFARHPLSLLTLGDLGWLQTLTFVVAGVLFVASAFGMRLVLDRDNAWSGLFAIGLIAGGLSCQTRRSASHPAAPLVSQNGRGRGCACAHHVSEHQQLESPSLYSLVTVRARMLSQPQLSKSPEPQPIR